MRALEAVGERVRQELSRMLREREPDPAPPAPTDRPPAAAGDRTGTEPGEARAYPAAAVFGHTADRHERQQVAASSGSDPVEAAAARAVRGLNSEGDRVVVSLTGEGKVVAPVPVGGVPVPLGGKAQYGYDVTIQQAGNARTPGADDAAPTRSP